MSRMNRTDFFASKTPRRSQPTKAELKILYDRRVKKAMREAGLIGPKLPKLWQLGDVQVEAHTRSEARACFKKELGVKTLPPGLKIERVL